MQGFVLLLICLSLLQAKQATCLRGASSSRVGTCLRGSSRVGNQFALCMLPEEEKRLVDLYERATKSTVFISRTRLAFNPVMMNVLEVPSQAGSGFVWDDDGRFIVTNAHVVSAAGGSSAGSSSSSAEVLVTMVGGKTLKAKIRGLDAARDVAVLELRESDEPLRGMAKGSSAGLRVGQTAIAIGNPFGLDLTMTRGIVSGLGRTVGISSSGSALYDMIQVDCAINPGNSGGPLLDSSGNLIGMNTAIYSTSGASAGIGFAIPVDALKTFVEILIRDGKLAPINTGLRGIPYRFFSASRTVSSTSSSSNSTGLLVVNVERGSAAEVAGLRASSDPELADILLACNSIGVSSQADLDRAFFLAAAAAQNIVTLLVERRLGGGVAGGEKRERIKTEIRMELRR